MKGIKGECREGWNSPVLGICSCSFLGASWVPCVGVHDCSRGDSVWLFILWGLGFLCKCKGTFTALSLVLLPVWCLLIVINGHASSDQSPGPMCYKTISNHIDYHIISKKTRRLKKTQKNIIKIFITQRHRIQPLRFSRPIFLAYMWTHTTAYMTWETVHKSRRSKQHTCTIRGHISLIILFLIILPSP